MMYNHELLERLIAPEISEFTSADIPDLSFAFKELNHWMTNHFLNSAFSLRFRGNFRILVLNQIYRTQNCLLDYGRARDLTLYYLERTHPSRPAVEAYFRALSAWEASLINFSIATDIFKSTNAGEGSFQKGDGSTAEQAYSLANAVKHYGSEIAQSPVLLEAAELLPAPDGERSTIPLWLTSDGFKSLNFELSFSKYAEALKELGALGDKLSDPAAWIEQAKRERKSE